MLAKSTEMKYQDSSVALLLKVCVTYLAFAGLYACFILKGVVNVHCSTSVNDCELHCAVIGARIRSTPLGPAAWFDVMLYGM